MFHRLLDVSFDWSSPWQKVRAVGSNIPMQKTPRTGRNLCQIRSHRKRSGLCSSFSSSTLSFRLYKKMPGRSGSGRNGLGWLGTCSSTPACAELQLKYGIKAQILGLAAHIYEHNVFCRFLFGRKMETYWNQLAHFIDVPGQWTQVAAWNHPATDPTAHAVKAKHLDLTVSGLRMAMVDWGWEDF